MKYEGQEIHRAKLFTPGATIEGVELKRCTLRNCYAASKRGQAPITIRHIRAEKTTLKSATASFCAFEDVVIDGLKTSGVEFVRSCVFKHVTLKGRIEKLVLANEHGDDGAWMSDYYADVDWALDITEAVVKELDIRNVPASLVRRDVATQAVIRRENLPSDYTKPKKLRLADVCIDYMLDWDREDCILIAPKGNKKLFPEVMEEIRTLREAGIADPD